MDIDPIAARPDTETEAEILLEEMKDTMDETVEIPTDLKVEILTGEEAEKKVETLTVTGETTETPPTTEEIIQVEGAQTVETEEALLKEILQMR